MTHTSPRIRKRFLAVSLASLAIALVAPSPVAAQDVQVEETATGPDFAHDASDLEHDPRAIYGTLPNGLRYAVMRNSTPSEVAAIRMRIDTGSWNETEEQRGIAHFLEHMAFNGSKNVPEGEMIKRLERHGLAFGADTNASTGFDQTVYKLNLPTVDEAVIDEALFLMRETASNLTLDAEAIDRERGVIASEKSARDSVSFRSLIDNIGFFTEGSGRIDRLPIGADETIATMPRSEFVRYYQDFYRPENTFIVFVGDIDPQVAIAKIEQNFADYSTKITREMKAALYAQVAHEQRKEPEEEAVDDYIDAVVEEIEDCDCLRPLPAWGDRVHIPPGSMSLDNADAPIVVTILSYLTTRCAMLFRIYWVLWLTSTKDRSGW